MSNHNINRKRARRQHARYVASRKRELQELDRTEITIETPQEIAQELELQRQRMKSWIADGSIHKKEHQVRVIASKWGLR